MMEKCVTPTPGLLPATPIIRGWGKLPFLQNAPLFFCLQLLLYFYFSPSVYVPPLRRRPRLRLFLQSFANLKRLKSRRAVRKPPPAPPGSPASPSVPENRRKNACSASGFSGRNGFSIQGRRAAIQPDASSGKITRSFPSCRLIRSLTGICFGSVILRSLLKALRQS